MCTSNVARYTSMPRGGKFGRHEQPGMLAHDVAESFRTLR
jgi:hypothetical protein